MAKITLGEAKHAMSAVLRDPKKAVGYGKAVRNRILPPKDEVFKEDVPGLVGAHQRAIADGYSKPLFVVSSAREAEDIPPGAAPATTFNRDLAGDELALFDRDTLRAADPDAIIVGSANKNDYSNVLRALWGMGVQLPVYTDRTDYEWIGSDLPLFSDAEDHVLYFHNYLPEHFGIKDPVQVTIRVVDAGRQVKLIHHILGPNATLVLEEKDLGLHNKNGAFVTSRCWHPKLTFGRHRRMRIAADVLSPGAVATLHSTHAFGPTCNIQGQLTAPPDGRLVVTVPDYPDSQGDGKSLRLRVGNLTSLQDQTFQGTLNQEVDLSPYGPGQVRYTFDGQANGFWYRQCDGVLASNHHVTAMFDAAPPTPLSEADVERLTRLEDGGLLFLPHGLPIPRAEDRFRATFSCINSIPVPKNFRLAWFDASGTLVDRTEWAYDGSKEFIAPEDLDAKLAGRCQGGLVMVSPDWRQTRLDPTRQGFYADLVLHEVDGDDMDFTEFQDSWMNLGGYVKDAPRWMFPPGVNTARTNVVCRGVSDGTLDTQLLVVIASGDLAFDRAGTMEVWFYRPDGRALRTERTVAPWRYQVWDLQELFPDLRTFCPEGRGYVRVKSMDIDSKVYGITRRKGGGIGVQHFWGY